MECKLTKIICDELKRYNCKICIISGGSVFQTTGLPDRFISHSMWSGWIEFKDSETQLTKLQTYWIKEFRQRGQNAVVVRFPYRIEDHSGAILSYFDGSAGNLLKRLSTL